MLRCYISCSGHTYTPAKTPNTKGNATSCLSAARFLEGGTDNLIIWYNLCWIDFFFSSMPFVSFCSPFILYTRTAMGKCTVGNFFGWFCSYWCWGNACPGVVFWCCCARALDGNARQTWRFWWRCCNREIHVKCSILLVFPWWDLSATSFYSPMA